MRRNRRWRLIKAFDAAIALGTRCIDAPMKQRQLDVAGGGFLAIRLAELKGFEPRTTLKSIRLRLTL
jgi:hypothetical protein